MSALVRYHGGKVRMSNHLISLFPSHEVYIEPFGGGAAVLLAKDRCRLEIYNDLDGDMVTLFRVLRDRPDDLVRSIALTPFAREEHQKAYDATSDDTERARRVLIRSHFGHGSSGIHRKTGLRASGLRAGTLPVNIWARFPDVVARAAERMQGVVIERRPAIQVMQSNDAPGVLHYVDPPYLPETRDAGRDYQYEMTVGDHEDLLAALVGLDGNVVLSGYPSRLYDEALRGWRRVEITARADRAGERTEVVWMNFEDQAPLFAMSTKGSAR